MKRLHNVGVYFISRSTIDNIVYGCSEFTLSISDNCLFSRSLTVQPATFRIIVLSLLYVFVFVLLLHCNVLCTTRWRLHHWWILISLHDTKTILNLYLDMYDVDINIVNSPLFLQQQKLESRWEMWWWWQLQLSSSSNQTSLARVSPPHLSWGCWSIAWTRTCRQYQCRGWGRGSCCGEGRRRDQSVNKIRNWILETLQLTIIPTMKVSFITL